jgi:hypothetical protein
VVTPLHGQDKFYYVSPSNEGRHCFSLIFFFCFFSAKLVRTITFLSFQIGQLYLLCGCIWCATLRLMVMHPHTKYHWPISKNKNVMTQTRKYYLIKFFWPWDQRSRSHEGHFPLHGQDKFYFTCIMWPLVFQVPLHGQDKFYYVSPSNEGKNNYLTLRSKVKVPRRSLWCVTLRLMVMHPHTKYHWPISKNKNVMTQTRKYYLI